jgi:hypothetical protein
VLRIILFGEKVGQKNFLKILPPPQIFSLKKTKNKLGLSCAKLRRSWGYQIEV